MKLDEDINLCEDIDNTYNQLAEWSKDYKRLLEKEEIGKKHHCISCKYSNHFSGKCMNVDSCLCGEIITPDDWCTDWEG